MNWSMTDKNLQKIQTINHLIPIYSKLHNKQIYATDLTRLDSSSRNRNLQIFVYIVDIYLERLTF